MDENGAIREVDHDDTKTTAEKHTSSAVEKDLDEVTEKLESTDMFAGLQKKKKPKKTEDEPTEAAPVADGEFDPSSLKKKKKKTKPKDDDFEAKLAQAGVETAEEPTPTGEQEGDWEKGTGVFAHDNNTAIAYPLLLDRFFNLLNHFNPGILDGGSKSYKIPPPQCLREGNKKTIFANISDICKRMKRNDEHVIQFLFAELGTSGSVDGSKRLVIKGRFQQKQIENVLRSSSRKEKENGWLEGSTFVCSVKEHLRTPDFAQALDWSFMFGRTSVSMYMAVRFAARAAFSTSVQAFHREIK
ncbi:translation initiation factor eIF-2 beta subunit [Lithohypha guttulata]|uniref:translation initiation factor eIF-2 beta subunit n=1 Tax=Lithohypha guttulata TaxID=1690604 RepID=UPI002DDE5B80|nr:translation initiation factor eIF-2 beta subunit [Lithohypha guttulata]